MNTTIPIEQMEKYADLYVKHKVQLFPLMEDAIGKPIPVDITHGEAIDLYLNLLKTNPFFKEEVDKLIGEYSNAVDPITAIANAANSLFSGTFGVIGKKQDLKALEAQSELEKDRFFRQLILKKEGGNMGTILIISAVALIAVGVGIYFIVKRKK
jgi:hypothetical protein